jgi:hypothetical protein
MLAATCCGKRTLVSVFNRHMLIHVSVANRN